MPFVLCHQLDIKEQMKVLITGGAGFIGSHLTDYFVLDGAEVSILDNLTTGSKENLKGPASQAKFFMGDIRFTRLIHKCLFHISARA